MRVRGIAAFFAMSVAVFPAEDAPAATDDTGAYAGSEKCRKCHPVAFNSWKESLHSRIVASRDVGILKDAVAKWSSDGTNSGPETANITGRKVSLADVTHVVGSQWKQRYLVKNELSGGHQFLDKQFNRISGKWEKYGNKNDWDSSCATCHTTGYRLLKYDPAHPGKAEATWVELGIGCEMCHGPGARHVKTGSLRDVWNPARQTAEAQSRLCGYCHIRLENEQYKNRQGNNREDFPAPEVGTTFKPWDDWRKWYPERAVIPGVHAEDGISADYKGDLKGMYQTDEAAKTAGFYEEGKHHQQYQGFLQSAHYRKAGQSCLTCHSPHAGKARAKKEPSATCVSCHDSSYTVEKYMPATAKTADNLFVRTHTFNPKPRKGGPTATGKPVYNK